MWWFEENSEKQCEFQTDSAGELATVFEREAGLSLNPSPTVWAAALLKRSASVFPSVTFEGPHSE